MNRWPRIGVRTGLVVVVVAGASVAAVLAGDGPRGSHDARISPRAAAGVSGARGAGATQSAPAKAGQPVVEYVVPRISRPLRDLPVATGPAKPRPEAYEPGALRPLPGPSLPDGAVQRFPGTEAMDPPLENFKGATNRDNFLFSLSKNSSRPPDNEGNVGPNHYVEWINTVLQIFDKNGNSLKGPVSGEKLFESLNQPPDPTDVCTTTNQGDPLVLYDQLADRWVLSQFAFNIEENSGALAPPYKQCVAVSTGPNPLGTYCTYSFLISADSFNDYGKIGMHPNGYYFSYNMFAGGAVFAGGGVQWTDRQAMLDCQTTASVVFTPSTNPALATTGGLLPADLDGTTPPPANSPEFFLALGGSTTLELWKFNVDTANPANSTFSPAPVNIPVPSYSTGVGSVPQKDTPNRLDSISDRLMYRLAYRNWGANPPAGIPANTESLVVNHTVNAGGHAGVRWYEIRNPNASPVAYQASTYSPDSHYRWMGSAAQDRHGNLAVGYSVSGSDMYPSIRYAGRLQGDPLNQLQAEASIIEGPAPAPVATGTAGDTRWGDYTDLSLDPIDDCTFWYVNEYMVPDLIPEDTVATKSRWWHTRIASFKFPDCELPTAVAVRSFGARWHRAGVNVSWRTGSEARVLGYNLYRSADAGPFRKLNRMLIAAKRAGSAGGAAYRFPDRTVKGARTYTYRLQVVETGGKRSWYGVGSTAVRR